MNKTRILSTFVLAMLVVAAVIPMGSALAKNSGKIGGADKDVSKPTDQTVLSKLNTFFEPLGITETAIQDYHDGGAGYGVIAQALWMTALLGGDAALFDQIMAAKLSGDFSGIVLPDGTIVTNWGALRKDLLTGGKYNLGQIISGKATLPDSKETTIPTTHGKSNQNGSSHGNNGGGNGNGKKP
jgi:hypothetical protein